MAIPHNREIWENGTPLNAAWLEFAASDAKLRYSERPTLETFNEQAAASPMQSIPDISNLLSIGMRQWTANSQIQKELQELLLDELFNDHLHAYGYRLAPSRSRAPVRIAAELFECPEVDWKRNRMIARGCTYSEIQIIDPVTIGGWRKPRHGPKGSGDVIRVAIAAIQNRDIDLSNMPRKLASNLIRREIGGTHVNGSGMSDMNLSKYIVEICGSRRKKND